MIVGDGVDRDKLRSAMPTAVFAGALYGDELAAAYASMDVFVHPGEHETFCQVVQEALASGLPVIAPDAGGPRDLITPWRTGLLLGVNEFEARLPEAVAHLIAERARYATAARRSVVGRSWPVICDELLGHYEAVLSPFVRRQLLSSRYAQGSRGLVDSQASGRNQACHLYLFLTCRQEVGKSGTVGADRRGNPRALRPDRAPHTPRSTRGRPRPWAPRITRSAASGTKRQRCQAMPRLGHPPRQPRLVYRGAAALRGITQWLPHLSDTP